MSQSSWLVAGIVPGVEPQPLKKLAADEIALLKLLHRRHPDRTKRAVVPVGLGASVLARYGYARCVNNVGLNAACPQPTRQPETIPASLEGDCSLLAAGTSTAGPLLQVTRTVPIVFTVAVDPVGAGLVDSLARPGGNATGFLSSEYGLGGKWLEVLKEIAPGVTRVAVLRNSDIA